MASVLSNKRSIALLGALVSSTTALGAPQLLGAIQLFVAPAGNDANSGTNDAPFRTITWASKMLQPGDTCFVREGVYRETITLATSGKEKLPIRLQAWPGEVVVLSGTEPIKGPWTAYKGPIYRTNVEGQFEQLFVDGQMMIEARWPNVGIHELLERSRWAKAGKGSRYGRIVDPELAKTDIDWTGALATLNVAHQFFSWTRTVRKHSKEMAFIEYDRNLGKLIEMRFSQKTWPWIDDFYVLSGKLEALDSPGEWYLDPQQGSLYLWPPHGTNPSELTVEAKVRDYAITSHGTEFIELSGFHFFGTTFDFDQCNHVVVENCHLKYPAYARRITEQDVPCRGSVRTRLSGRHNVLRNCSLAHSPTSGFTVQGSYNRVENNLVHDVCWTGSLHYTGISVGSAGKGDNEGGCIITRNSVYGTGNACISVSGMPNNVVEYCHIHNGGTLCKDVSLLYTQLPLIEGTIFHHNWIHDVHTDHIALGIRGDDQTRGLAVHHNVVWNCGWDGIVVKGDRNRVFHNTCLSNGQTDILLMTQPEPRKPWRKQWPLLEVQNANSQTYNNCAQIIRGQRGREVPPGGIASNNFEGEIPLLADPENYDFRPADNSPLIDKGQFIEGVALKYTGTAPDAGAYEHGSERWIPGARNGLWFSSPRRKQGTSHLSLKVALTLPVSESVELSVESKDPAFRLLSSERLRFDPSNWMRPQELTFEPVEKAEARPSIPSLQIRAVGLGNLIFDEQVSPDVAAGRSVSFDQGSMVGMRPITFRYR